MMYLLWVLGEKIDCHVNMGFKLLMYVSGSIIGFQQSGTETNGF